MDLASKLGDAITSGGISNRELKDLDIDELRKRALEWVHLK